LKNTAIGGWLEADGIDFIEISGAFRRTLPCARSAPAKRRLLSAVAAQFKKILKSSNCRRRFRSLEIINGAINSGQCDSPRPCLDRSSASPTCRRFCALAAKAMPRLQFMLLHHDRPTVVIPEAQRDKN
jgi:hypothetical protein